VAWVAARRRSDVLLWATAVVVVADQLTKHWAVTALDDGRTIDVVWTLEFSLSFNSGMAFSTGRQWGALIGTVALIAGVALCVAVSRVASVGVASGLALVAGGAFGNVVDRLFRDDGWMRGSVVDFIDFGWFPSFNIADSAVTVGGLIVVAATWFEPAHRSARADPAEPGP
jgi:signal peptidase II